VIRIKLKVINSVMTPFNQHLLQILLLCFLLCFQLNSIASHPYTFCSSDSLDDTRRITGTITDEEGGQRLSTVMVTVKFTDITTSTDVAGNFVLDIPSGDITLVFVHAGYETKEMDIEFQSNLILFLKRPDDFIATVAVGYGTVEESDLTGSIATINKDQITAYPSINLIQAMQGRAAGLNIMANNGEPGSDYKVRIRGATSINASSNPIYVVDGFVQAALPPAEDIASIVILKDASAASIYGSRGANGVILISTKTGKPGRTKIELNTSYSFQKVTRKLDLLNANQFAVYRQEVDPGYEQGDADTDWQEEIFRTGGIQNTKLALSGGTESLNYYISGNYWGQKGVVLGSKYDRFSILSNLKIQANQRLSIGLNMFAKRTQKDGILTQETTGGSSKTGVISSALNFEPDEGIYNPDNSFTLKKIKDRFDNPFAIATERIEKNVDDLIQAHFFADYKISSTINFKSTIGASTNSVRNGLYIPRTLVEGNNLGGSATIIGAKNTTLLNENYLNYSKTINNNHELSAMAGYSFQKFRNEIWSSGGNSFLSDIGDFWNLDNAAIIQQPHSTLLESVLASFYGRFNYSFSDKYLVTFNARRDGSSTFSKNNKWAFFPSGALAWNIHKEKFMQDTDWLSQLKMRSSYGLTGNQAIAPYQTLASFSSVFTVINGIPVNAIAPMNIANNDLTWETTAQWNVGADLELFEGRVGLTIDYYQMRTYDLLLNVSPVEFSGFDPQLKNSGEIENKGLELSIYSDISKGSVRWSAEFNISGNRNKILVLPDGNDILYRSRPGHMTGIGDTQVLREGEPIGVFFGWIYDGVIQEDEEMPPDDGFEHEKGGEKFIDLNNDGVLNNNDRTIIGNPNPDFIWSLNNEFGYNNFDLNIFFQGSQGNDILSYTLLELDNLKGSGNATTVALDRWKDSNTDTDVPQVNENRDQRVSSRWIYDGSYIRLKNVSLGYSFQNLILNKWNIRKLRLFVSAQNILTITKYKGYDPEVNFNSIGNANSNKNLGLDYGSYPTAKSFTFGLNIEF